jgi:hypothetical protein
LAIFTTGCKPGVVFKIGCAVFRIRRAGHHAALRLLGHPELDPWEVNTERSYYEEQVLSPDKKHETTDILLAAKILCSVSLPPEFGDDSKQNGHWCGAFHRKSQTAHADLTVKPLENFCSLFA